MGIFGTSIQSAEYTPTVTGFSTTTELKGTYTLIGKLCTVAILVVGTSNATSFTVTLPFDADVNPLGGGVNAKYAQIVYALNNSAGIGTALFRTRTGSSNIADVYTTAAGGVWVASGTKGVALTFSYYIE